MMGTSLRNRQAHADHVGAHGSSVTCPTVASQTDAKKEKKEEWSLMLKNCCVLHAHY